MKEADPLKEKEIPVEVDTNKEASLKVNFFS